MSSRLFLPNKGYSRLPLENQGIISPDKFTLVCQGGGISGGAYVVGVMKAFKEHDLLQHIDSVYLSSASAPAVTYTLMDQWEELAYAWTHNVTSNDVVNFSNVFRGKVINIGSLVDTHLNKHPIDKEKFSNHEVDINFSVSEVMPGRLKHTFLSNKDPYEPLEMIKAAISIPVLYGGVVVLGGKTYIDGGVSSQLPFHEVPLNKKMVTVMTQSHSQPLSKSSIGEKIMLWYDVKQHKTSPVIMDAIKKRGYILREEYHDLILRHGMGQSGVIIRPEERLASFVCDNSSFRVQKTIDSGYADGLSSIKNIEKLVEFDYNKI